MSLDGALSYFRALRARGPADAEHLERFGLPLGLKLGSGGSREQASRFHGILRDELDKLDPVQRVLVATYLFGPGADRDRQRVAGERLSGLGVRNPDHYFRNHCTRALEAYCGRLVERLEFESSPSTQDDAHDDQARRWYEVTGISMELELSPNDFRQQQWTTTLELRSRRRDNPIVFFRHVWTGSGRRARAVVLSGQDEERRKRGHEHSLVRDRPESDHATSVTLKIFDLGSPLAPGVPATLRFTQGFFDRGCSFQPYLGWTNKHHPLCKRVTLAVIIPPKFGVREARVWEELPDIGSSDGFAADAPLEVITADESGRFEYGFRDVRYRRRYMIDWSDASYNSARA